MKKLSTYFALFVMLSSVMLTPATALAAQDSNEPVTTETRSIKDESTSAANTSASDSSTGQSSQLGENNTENSLPVTENSSSKQQTTNEQSSSASTTSDSRSDEQATSTTETNNKAESSSSKASSESKEATADKPKEPRKSVNDILGNLFTDAYYTDANGNRLDSDDQVNIGDKITLNYEWAIPEDVRDQINPGDTYDFTLPEGMKVIKEMSGSLKDANGNTYGTYVVHTDGTVSITFTDEISKHSNITGSFYVSGTVKMNSDGSTPSLDIPFTDGDSNNVPDITVKEGASIDKSVVNGGNITVKDGKANITWKIGVNKTTNELPKGTVVKDPMPDGFTYKGNEKVMSYHVNADGSLSDGKLVDFDDVFTKSGNVEFALKDGADHDRYYEIQFDTEADLSKINDEDTSASGYKVSNKATLHRPGSDDLPADASATFKNGSTLDKSGEMQANGTIKWTVTIKTKGAGLDAGTVLKDVMNNNQVLTDAQGNELTGNAIKTGITSDKGLQLTTAKTGNGKYEVTLDSDAAPDTTYTLTYYSKPTGDGNNPSNTNKISWDGGNDSGTVTNGKSGIVKSADKNGMDTTNHTQDYTITVNSNHKNI